MQFGHNRWCQGVLLALALGVVALMAPGPFALAQEQPHSGGELIMAVPSEPPSYDGHREETFGLIHPIAPFYSLLLRVDPNDYTQVVGDVAERWTVADDKLSYTFTIRQGVTFHDGSLVTAQDVKASYDKIIFPPAGVVSDRQGQYAVVEAVEAPDDSTVRFRLKWPSASFLLSLASPWNFIYKADMLAKDTRPDADKVTELFYWALSRPPTPEQLDRGLENIAEYKNNKKLAYENIIWALINTKEFILVQ